LIASTQRFGEGEGRKGRHDLVFFERNGLRHGEFGLREEEGGRYKVKEVSWNADSTALAVWIERGEGGKDGDVGELVMLFFPSTLLSGGGRWAGKEES